MAVTPGSPGRWGRRLASNAALLSWNWISGNTRLGEAIMVTRKLLLTPKEAGIVLSISRSKIYELIQSGALESIRIDGCRRIPVEAVEGYVRRLIKAAADQQADPAPARPSGQEVA
jgi:excisionase family DNA binding protein